MPHAYTHASCRQPCLMGSPMPHRDAMPHADTSGSLRWENLFQATGPWGSLVQAPGLSVREDGLSVREDGLSVREAGSAVVSMRESGPGAWSVRERGWSVRERGRFSRCSHEGVRSRRLVCP